MKKIVSVCLVCCCAAQLSTAQNVGINNTNPTSALDINGGLRLRPVTSLVSGTSITLSPLTGYHFLNGVPTGNFAINFSPVPDEGKHTIISNTTSFTGNLFGLLIPPATTVELFYSNGGWKQIGSSQSINSTAWQLTGNTATDTAIHFIGTADDKPLVFKIDNKRAGLLDKGENTSLGYLAMPSININAAENTGMGARSLNKLITGTKNTAVGVSAAGSLQSGDLNVAIGQFALASDTVGSESVAIGGYALGLNQNREGNTAVGSFSLFNNTNPDLGVVTATQGLHNTALGHSALFNNRTGSGNVAIGFNAAFKGTNLAGSIAIGRAALYNFQGSESLVAIGDSAMFNTTNNPFSPLVMGNTAVGSKSLYSNLTGKFNTAIGTITLPFSLGDANTAVGFASLYSNTTGRDNTTSGYNSLFGNTTGKENAAYGTFALASNTTGSHNAAFGYLAAAGNTTGRSNVAIGGSALRLTTFQSNLVAIGDSALFNNGSAVTNAIDAIRNTAVGSKAMYTNHTGSNNTVLGYRAAFLNTSGSDNIAVGSEASRGNIFGDNNIAIGSRSIYTNQEGSFNIAIGTETLYNLGGITSAGAQNNIAIGFRAGYNSFRRSGNIFLGTNAGYFAQSHDKLYIENSDKDSLNALIYGDFAADSLLLNTKTINKYSLNVRGNYPIEMGYGTAGKQVDAGKIQYGGFGDPAHWLAIVGGGTNATGNDRVVKLWSEGGLRIRGNALPDAASTYTIGTTTAPWRSVTTDSARSNAYMLRNSSMHIVGATGELVFRLNSIDIAKVNSGGISPAADNDVFLGSPSSRFVSVYAVNGTIQTSDANLKTNISPSHYGLREIMALNPVKYNWKNKPNEEKMVGFLAQEVKNIIPEAVVVPNSGDPLGMKYNELIPVLVKAIQEQQQKIAGLEKMVKNLQKLTSKY